MAFDRFCFVDFETRSRPGAGEDGNLKTAGTYRYVRHAVPILLSYAIDDGPVRLVEVADMRVGIRGDDLPGDLRDCASDPKTAMVAFNAGFDRNVWNAADGFPPLPVTRWLDAMAQAVASNLPPNLEGASRAIGGAVKTKGKSLIGLFSPENGFTPADKPAEWAEFKQYAIDDTAALRDVFFGTRPLSDEEWQDYWTSERINDRGVAVDVHSARAADRLAAANAAEINRQLARWTNGQITAVTQTARITDWVYDRLTLHPEARDMLVRRWDEDAEGDEDRKPAKLSLTRQNIEAVLAFYGALEEKQDGLSDADWLIVDVLEARQYGGSTSPAKFAKIVEQHVDGVLHGQYVFNGAAQTGRFSSKGVQVHNLTRSSMGRHEVEALNLLGELGDEL